MLQIDEGALDAFRELGSIRIVGIEADGEVELEIEEAEAPADDDDQIVEREGVRIFLNRVAANALDDQVIGVEAHDDHFHFTFEDQPG
jgi:Fe-S cluster assembly iron-binding protein IscA